ncbi:acyltransferase family protein [Amaricoccus sp.]|uniref:acyltransferase family protein n=1 Tax=Amaricoccus sp. TaxID=1872485 RepID=UPI003458EDCA
MRAVAVLPVILFHAGIPAFSGGWLGVDVFFVISGYLITGILLRDLERGEFSIARFYERRARRIVPALAFVLLACIPFGLAWMSPPQLAELARGTIAAALSVSNVLYWLELDYFGPAAEHLPLLHTWSLGVEEQFYLLFPLALAFLWRRGSGLAVPFLLAGGLSLAAAAWAFATHPSAGFFLLPFRAWELLVGAGVAVAATRAAAPSGFRAGAGLVAVVAAMAAVPLGLVSSLPAMALASAGVALVLRHGAPGLIASRLLAHPAPVGIGLVSYSAYLWHQPVLAFARIRFGDDLPLWLMAMLGLSAILLAWPTWAFVEQPFRRHSPAGPGRPLAPAGPGRPLAVAAAALAGLAAIGVAGVATDGLAMTQPPAVRAILATVSDVNPWRDRCKTGFNEANPIHPRPGCLLAGDGPRVAFWGDSHADALQGAMFPAAQAAGLPFYSVTRSACPPVPGLTRTGDAASPGCDAFNRGVEAYVTGDNYDVAVVVARWSAGIGWAPFDNLDGGVDPRPGDVLTPIGTAPPDDAARERAVVARMAGAVRDLLGRGLRVVLVYPIPEAGWNVPEELARRRAASDAPVTLSIPAEAYARRNAAIIAAFDAIADPHLWRVRPAEVFCDADVPGRCVQSLGDQPLYFDESHLNNAGARLLVPAIMRAIEAARRDAAP